MTKKSLPSNHIAVVMLPNLSRYPNPPEDQPGCLLYKCSQCDQPAWISTKKRDLQATIKAENLYMCCYDCFEKKAKEDPSFLNDHCVLNI